MPLLIKPIAITTGDPAGIGPDIIIKLLRHKLTIPIILIGDQTLLHQRAAQLHLTLPKHIDILHTPLQTPSQAGKPNVANVPYILSTLKIAVKKCLHHECAAMITGPVSKAIIHQSGAPFLGHTEWLANRMNVKQTLMLFVNDAYKIALCTTHIPLAQVPKAMTKNRLIYCINQLYSGLQHYFNRTSPKILVCGLNPHAGESGLLGREEMDIMIPVIQALKSKRRHIDGPVSADTAFTPKNKKQYDAILAMYHDQGLPVIKTQGIGAAVNLTLGLPILRTSVDHGTAFEIAGSGDACEAGLIHALTLTDQIIKNQRETHSHSII